MTEYTAEEWKQMFGKPDFVCTGDIRLERILETSTGQSVAVVAIHHNWLWEPYAARIVLKGGELSIGIRVRWIDEPAPDLAQNEFPIMIRKDFQEISGEELDVKPVSGPWTIYLCALPSNPSKIELITSEPPPDDAESVRGRLIQI